MTKTLKLLATIFAALAVLALPVSCAAYKFNDCKAVGHKTFYCILDMGK